MRNYEMILCAKEGKTPFWINTQKVVERYKTEISDPKELKKKIKTYEKRSLGRLPRYDHRRCDELGCHNVDPMEKPMELQLSDSVFIGSHACSCGAWCCGAEDLMPAEFKDHSLRSTTA